MAQSIVMTLRLSPELKAELEAAAALEHRSTNNYIVHLLRTALTPPVTHPGDPFLLDELVRTNGQAGRRDVTPRLKG